MNIGLKNGFHRTKGGKIFLWVKKTNFSEYELIKFFKPGRKLHDILFDGVDSIRIFPHYKPGKWPKNYWIDFIAGNWEYCIDILGMDCPPSLKKCENIQRDPDCFLLKFHGPSHLPCPIYDQAKTRLYIQGTMAPIWWIEILPPINRGIIIASNTNVEIGDDNQG
jgi:hypothetical protein